VPLAPLLERVISLEIRLDVHLLGAPDVDLLADPDQIEQLLINLVRNAVEAATICLDEDRAPTHLADSDRLMPTEPNVVIPAATEACLPEVTLCAVEEGALVCIAIDDNGPGLANPDNLFVPLYTTKKSGTGVGLALARQIVEAHGGSIELRNRNGQGCRAEVRLPIAERR
jgi:signal transduction histidine kinase